MNLFLTVLVLIAVVLLVVVVSLPEPVRSWFRRFGWRALRRTRTEDALKHLFDCEYHGRPATRESLVGALGLSGRRTAELLAGMEELGLLASREGGFRLTDEGRGEALRVIRIHRLWERYFADETGLEPQRWHPEAERREHLTSPAQADDLSVRLGHPRFDPHGDPIPTSEGELPPRAGRPLTDFTPGDDVEVVHVEDEPPTVFAQLVEEGIHPGMTLSLASVTPERVRFAVDFEEVELAPVVAANIFAVPAEEVASGAVSVADGPAMPLSSVRVGDEAEVVGFSRRCRGLERRRLLDLGLLPGTVVKARMASPAGDPVAYRVRGAVIALRRSQARQIKVRQSIPESST